jgi:ABC-2 type transport system ATP-binding protein
LHAEVFQMTESNSVLSCQGVTKRYGRKTVLADISLELAPGEVFGFLGPNGAGKTTLIKSLLGLVTPQAGEIHLFGHNLFLDRIAALHAVGAVVEAPLFTECFSAFDNLKYLASFTAPVEKCRIEEVLERVGLGDVARTPVGTFSYGMKQRLGIAQALLPSTRLLILDEPTNGLDPHGIAGMRQLIRSLSRDQGLTVFLSSHLLYEVEQVCDRFMIIHHGQKMMEGTMNDPRLQQGATLVEVTVRRDGSGMAAPTLHPAFVEVVKETEEGQVVIRFSAADVPALVRDLVAGGAAIDQVKPIRRSLEDIFIELTRKPEGGDARNDSF